VILPRPKPKAIGEAQSSGAPGTTVGLFEPAVDEFCGWSLDDGRRTGPKVVASTATTKRAVEQVKGCTRGG
jgi:hypothetical protein